MTQTIERAAIRCPDGTIFTLPRPARHHDIINTFDVPHDATQGFMTSDGIFARREPALRIAAKAGQLLRQTHPRQLFSEDVW